MTIFFFDDPGANPIEVWLLFFGINAYPIYLFIIYRFNLIVFKKWGTWGYVIPMAIVGFFAYLLIGEMIDSYQYKQKIKKQEEIRVRAGYLGKCQTYRLTNDSLFFNDIYFEADTQLLELLGCYYAKDTSFVYREDKIVKHADPNTFEKLRSNWQRDKTNYYYKGQLINGVDYGSFEILPANYAKDKLNVYYKGQIISGARASSFTVNSMDYVADDGVNKYKLGKIFKDDH